LLTEGRAVIPTPETNTAVTAMARREGVTDRNTRLQGRKGQNSSDPKHPVGGARLGNPRSDGDALLPE
jgi:hypothetical protein